MTGVAYAYNIAESDALLDTKADKKEFDKFKESGVPLGTTMWWHNRTLIPAGWIPADGQLVLRSQYPDLFDLIRKDAGRVYQDKDWLADVANRGTYTWGTSDQNFRVPDLNGKQSGSRAVVLRGDGNDSAITNGIIQGDAIRDFGGKFATLVPYGHAAYTGGCVRGTNGITDNGANPRYPFQGVDNGHVDAGGYGYDFYASRQVPTANENRMVNATGCFIIRAYGAIQNLGSMDAGQLQQSISAVDTRVTQNANAIAANVTVTNSNSTAINVTTNRVGVIEGNLNNIINGKRLPSPMWFTRENTIHDGGHIILQHPTDDTKPLSIDMVTTGEGTSRLRIFNNKHPSEGAYLDVDKQDKGAGSQLVTCGAGRYGRFDDNGGSVNGWRKLPDGYIEQWGLTYVAGFEGEFWVTFHFPFLSEVCSVQLGTHNYGCVPEVDLGYQLTNNYSRTGMSIYCNRWGGGAGNNCMWRVLGR